MLLLKGLLAGGFMMGLFAGCSSLPRYETHIEHWNEGKSKDITIFAEFDLDDEEKLFNDISDILEKETKRAPNENGIESVLFLAFYIKEEEDKSIVSEMELKDWGKRLVAKARYNVIDGELQEHELFQYNLRPESINWLRENVNE